MTEHEANELLDSVEDAELVPALQGPIQQVKDLVVECLAAEIPAAINRCKTKG